MTALTTTDQTDLTRLEKTIDKGKATFIKVGLALMEIRERRLYRLTHKTFEQYCQERFSFTRQRASQLICAASFVDKMSTRVDSDSLPENENKARELSRALQGMTDEEKAKTINRAETMFTFNGATMDGPKQVLRRLTQAELVAQKIWPERDDWFEAMDVLKALSN